MNDKIKDFEEDYKKIAERYMELSNHYERMRNELGLLKEFALKINSVVGVAKDGSYHRLAIREVLNSPKGYDVKVDLHL